MAILIFKKQISDIISNDLNSTGEFIFNYNVKQGQTPIKLGFNNMRKQLETGTVNAVEYLKSIGIPSMTSATSYNFSAVDDLVNQIKRSETEEAN